MEAHDWWHLLVMTTTLFGAAGLVIVLGVPLLFDEPPPGLRRARGMVLGLVVASAALLAAEWLGVH